MTPKQKAEAYVRSQIPELMELSFGCEIRVGVGEFKHRCNVTSIYVDGSGFKTNGIYATLAIEDQEHTPYEIIGHPIQLQHWLRVLVGKVSDAVDFDGHNLIVFAEYEALSFNLTTGQPATEADYQAFNEIVALTYHTL